MARKKEIHQYIVEGISVEIPAYFDKLSGLYIERYPDFKKNPVRTAEGNLLTLAVEDVCQWMEPVDEGKCIWCSECKHYSPAAKHTYFGVCRKVQNETEGDESA